MLSEAQPFFSTSELVLIQAEGKYHDYVCLNRIEEGYNKQNTNTSPGRRIDINIGLDLGTSYTKVVWRCGDKCYPICFGSDPSLIEDYLVPSVVYFDGQSLGTTLESLIDEHRRVEFNIGNFKICLACEHNPDSKCKIDRCELSKWNKELFSSDLQGFEVSFITAYFLATVLSKTRQLILSQVEHLLGISEPEIVRWSVNMAVPNRFWQYQKITIEFLLALKTAWLMSHAFDGLIHKESVRLMKKCYFYSRQLAETSEMDCFVHPETVAEVASFTQSRTSQDGLYALVDIGAGTVDASVFRLYTPPNGNRSQNDYAAKVLRTGSAFVESLAFFWFFEHEWFKPEYRGISVRYTRQYAANRLRNVLRQMKENGGSRSPEYKLIEETELQRALFEASNRIETRVKELLNELFNEAYRQEAKVDRWMDLKIIFGGGGASSPIYRKASIQAFTLHAHRDISPTIVDLPKPHDIHLDFIDDKDFHRFAVAYGLSFRTVDLVAFVPDYLVTPVVQPMRAKTLVAPSKDEC